MRKNIVVDKASGKDTYREGYQALKGIFILLNKIKDAIEMLLLEYIILGIIRSLIFIVR